MRIAIQCAAILAACSLGLSASAQTRNTERVDKKEETVVIKKSGGKTVIEIRDGAVFVDGDEVATLKDGAQPNVRKKIIVEGGGGSSGGRSGQWFGFDEDDDDYRDEGASRSSQRAALGVHTDPSSKKAGAYLKDVLSGSAAEKAGLKDGDVITRVDEQRIGSAEDLVDAIARNHKPGDKVVIRYQRDGKEAELNATLGEAAPRTAMRSFRFGPDGGMNMPGMPSGMFRSFPFPAADDAAAPKLGISAEDRADGSGVRVMAVKPGSPAEQAGIKEGDVVTRVGDAEVASVDELQMEVRTYTPGDRLKLRYERAGKSATASVLLPKPVKRKDL